MSSESPLLPDLSAIVLEFLYGEDIKKALLSGWFGSTRQEWDNVLKRASTTIYFHQYYALGFGCFRTGHLRNMVTEEREYIFFKAGHVNQASIKHRSALFLHD